MFDLSEPAVSDYDPCAGELAVKTEAGAMLKDVGRLAPFANVNLQWVAMQEADCIALVRTFMCHECCVLHIQNR